MYILDKIKQEIIDQLNKTLEQEFILASDLIFPPNPDLGDLSLPCFSLAAKLGKNPAQTAADLVHKVAASEMIDSAKAAGPYLNFILNKSYLAKELIGAIAKQKDKFGFNQDGKKEKVMIEYSNANTHKEYHVGHLRNICYGDSVNRILAANGYKALPVSYINDFGGHVAKTIWALQNFYREQALPENKGYFLGQVYVRSVQELEGSEAGKKEVGRIMSQIEARKGEEYKVWKQTRQWSIDGFAKIYNQLGVKFSNIFYESEFIDEGRKMVDELIEKKFLKKSQGAVIADLSEYDLGVLLFLRSDGTALYPVADLPLAIKKAKKYKLDQSIYVVDARQSLHFKQLFKVLELLGYAGSRMHLGYEVVKLPSGMMSSRSGNVITYEDLRKDLIAYATEETVKRHENWKEKKVSEVVNKLVIGAIKFEMIKISADQMITFDINKALRFDGFTAAYLQYTYARIRSIIKKSKLEKFDGKNLTEAKEHKLMLKMAQYPAVIKKAGQEYAPSEIAKYLFELAQAINDYYHSLPVLKAEVEVRKARIALINAASQIIANGLNLLGIEVMEEM